MKSGQASRLKKTPHRYEEIETWLRDLVIMGKAGELIPSEVDIANKFEVSRMTARQAVLNLMREGLVDRKRGAGTFIADGPLHRREGTLYSFTEDMRRRGKTPSSKLISAKIEKAHPEELKALNLTSGSKVIVIKRIRFADGIPFSLERVALIPETYEVLKADLENGSLHEALRELNFSPNVASSWITARCASSKEMTDLKLPKNIPLLVEKRVIENEKGNPIEFTETAYAANRYVVDMRLNLSPDAAAPFKAAPIAPA